MNRWTIFAALLLTTFFAIWTGLLADACFEQLWPGVWVGAVLGATAAWRILLTP